MSQALRDARRYEEAMERSIRPEDRPAFHLSARVGWLNDPNGFSFYDGQYHMFYQYHPYDSHWGPMHWGHAVSRDLLHWDYLPAAMAPDMPYDYDGCYSGSALTAPDGRHLLMYTGVQRVPQPDGSFRHLQTQNLAFGDGTDYEKFGGNPVISTMDLPAGGRHPACYVYIGQHHGRAHVQQVHYRYSYRYFFLQFLFPAHDYITPLFKTLRTAAPDGAAAVRDRLHIDHSISSKPSNLKGAFFGLQRTL